MANIVYSKILHMENYNIQNHNNILLSAACQLQELITFTQEFILIFHCEASH